jgi:hypothetical protein
MSQSDALKRIETLEARKRQDDLTVMVNAIVAGTGIDRDELVAEAERIASFMPANLTPRDQARWLARDMGQPDDQIEAMADQIEGESIRIAAV